jgi:hypothetical protein
MSTTNTNTVDIAGEALAALGLKGIDVDLTAADRLDIPEVDPATQIVLSELSVTELKLFGAMIAAVEGLANLRKQAAASALRVLADQIGNGETVEVPGLGMGMLVNARDVCKMLPDNLRTDHCKLSLREDAATAALYLAIRERLNYWGAHIAICRGGQICIPRDEEKN